MYCYKNYSKILNTPSSNLIILIEFKTNEQFIKILLSRLLQNIYKGIDFLNLVVLIYNKDSKIDKDILTNELKNSLISIMDNLDKDEQNFPKYILFFIDKFNQFYKYLTLRSMEKMEFFEQEIFRDKLRLKFVIQSFLDKFLNNYCIFILIHNLINLLKIEK